MPRLPLPILCRSLPFVLAGGSLLAQGALPLSGTYRSAAVGAYFDNLPACGGAGPIVFAKSGTVTFQSNGTFSFANASHHVCLSGTPFNGSDSGGGTYEVFQDGSMTLDFDPSNPGTVTEGFVVRPDGSILINTRDKARPDAFVTVVVKSSSGQSNASLNGTYHVVRLAQEMGGNARLVADYGTMSFNGAGQFTEGGRRHTVLANGATSSAPYSGSGTYSVAGDGALTVGGLGNGAIQPSAEMFFVGTGSGVRAALTVGVRQGAAMDTKKVRGGWGLASFEVELGIAPDLPNFLTGFGSLEATPATSASASTSVTVFDVSTNPLGTQSGAFTDTGSVTVGQDGKLTFFDSGSAQTAEGAVSSDGTVVVAQFIDQGVADIAVALHVPRAPVEYGAATAGTGGIAPRTAQQGLPHLGNAGFGLRVLMGRGAAPAVLALGLLPSAGFPFLGGTILLDPTRIVASPGLTLSGAAGVAGAGSATLSLPIPAVPNLDRARLYAQALVLDPGSAGGLSMSRGLLIELGR